jgi:hypothetical protein
MKPDKIMIQDAVSPVVAVMLMLVVTIIIASVVSGFAGGLMKDTKNPPQSSISATFSQSKGLDIYHTGGDPLETRYTRFYILPTSLTSQGQEGLSYDLNYTHVKDLNGCSWVVPNMKAGQCSFYRFLPGDVVHVDYGNITTIQTLPDGTVDYSNKLVGIGHPTKIGSTFDIELYDTLTSKMITKTTVRINS